MVAWIFTALVAAIATTSAPAGIPYAQTAVSDLSTPQLHHDEALRIRRDFGKRDFQIAIDAWERDTGSDHEIGEVRMWWARTSKADERSPFSAKIMRYVEIDYQRKTSDRWAVSFMGDRKRFKFFVELDTEGAAAAYADVVTETGERIPHCRADSSTLEARRFLGIPIGIKALSVRCTDADGDRHTGTVPYVKTKRGRIYRPR